MDNMNQQLPNEVCCSNMQHPPNHYKSKGYRTFKDGHRNDSSNAKFIYEDSPGRLYRSRCERNQQIPQPSTNDSSRVKWSRNNIAMTMEYFQPISSTPKRYSSQSDYSYAYYEPGAVMHHSNIPKTPTTDQPNCSSTRSSPKSIRSLLSKPDDKTKPKDRYTYTTRYGTQENIYEDVSSIRLQPRLNSSGQPVSAQGTSKIEFQDILHNHYRVLEELNLSVEELFLSTPKKSNALSPRNLLKRSTKYRNKAKGSDVISCKNVFASSVNELVVAEDSGFSGSSSGASYVGSLRNYKTALTRSNRNSREIDNFTNASDCNASQGSINVKVPNKYQKISLQLLNQLKGDKSSSSSKGLKFPFWNKRLK
ncbi:uncharacterized protein LOC119081786 [Bradysia coprophila]|uniref:uncharacterized protein LOC119081786 n=1 Tax=Bradysia coprophila TaxID=38358 RepID=UPI00187DBFC1|nr:uncharacterized protein LOC119081786 [Bradysia coprophila]